MSLFTTIDRYKVGGRGGGMYVISYFLYYIESMILYFRPMCVAM